MPTSTSPTQIMVIIGSLDIGGTERHLCQILPRLHGNEFEFTVTTISRRGALASCLERGGIEIMSPNFVNWITKFRLLNLVSTFVWLAMLIARSRPHVIHTFLPAAYLMGGICAILLKVPVRIMSRRSLNVYQQKHPLLQRLEFWLHGKMHFLIGNSTAVVQELQKEVLSINPKIELILNGVDPSPFQDPIPRRVTRSQLKVPEHSFTIICVANLIPYKGHLDLLHALHQIQPHLENSWKLLCVGRDDGPLTELQKQAKKYGLHQNVTWLGTRSDIPNLLCAADVGVLPSYQEGLSNFVLEGMAAGLPMIVTKVGGNPELVIHGKTGLLVPVGAPAQLGEAILRLARDRKQRITMGSAARKRQIQDFSLNTCISNYRNFYRTLDSHKLGSNNS